MNKFGKVSLVGAGPGDPDLLTCKAARIIAAADVIVHDRLVSDAILALTNPQARLIHVGKKAGYHCVPQSGINKLLVDIARQGKDVVRLKGGDPMIFGRGSEEMDILAGAGIAVEIVPGITAAQAITASTGVPLTHRGLATGVRYVTGHRKADEPLDLDWKGLADPETTLVVYMGAANIAEIARNLMLAGMPADLPVMAISSASLPTETRFLSRLDTIGAQVRKTELPSPVLFVIGYVVEVPRQHWGILNDSFFMETDRTVYAHA